MRFVVPGVTKFCLAGNLLKVLEKNVLWKKMTIMWKLKRTQDHPLENRLPALKSR